MRRMVGHMGLQSGVLDGREIRRALDQMDEPSDAATSHALFERVMLRLAEQQRRHRRARQLGQLARAAVTALVTGAGAYRLLIH